MNKIRINRILRDAAALAIACGMGLILGGCSTADTAMTPAPESAALRVADLQIVDCLLPAKVRRLGGARFMTARQPTRTTAADCRIRGGEYTEFDRADLRTSLAIWMPAAQLGDVEAMTNVGEIYERGLGGEPNYEAAAIWYEKAANEGHTRAQFNIGTLYEQGLGVPQDKVIALNWYRKAWGIPEDNVIMQSAARSELEAALQEKESRIQRLEASLERLQRELEAVDDSAQINSLNQEIVDLRDWVASLEKERAVAAAELAAIPVVAQPVAEVSSQPRLRTPTDSVVEPFAGDGSQATASRRFGDIDFGRYFALIIGNQGYDKIESLETPASDAREIAELLRDKYGFSVQVLLDASNIEIMETINDLNDRLGVNDNLLIYYAGHGARVQTGGIENGFWLPVNADAPPRNTYWVSNEFVTGHLERLSAKRVLVMADSCYAGLLSDSPDYIMLNDEQRYSEEFLRYKLPKRSRLLLSSGGDKPVLDNGAPNHSVFASAVLEVLRSNDEILSGPQLFAAIDDKVTQRARDTGFEQHAQYKVIKRAGHEVGDFFFVPSER